MPPGYLKQLKASIHARRTRRNTKNGPPTSTKPISPPNQPPKRGRNNPNPARADAIRRETLLPELQRRHKAGGIVDRRFGENDPTMAPEERMVQRFYANAAGRGKKARRAAFDLEAGDEEVEEDVLTHLGERLDGEMEENEDADVDGEELLVERRDGKRRRDEEEEAGQEEEQQRKKSKKEVMEEVIAKSKLHKYEKQKEKEQDEDKRDELRKDMPELLAALREGSRTQQVNGHAKAGTNGITQGHEKDYDRNLREMATEQKAKPAERTQTEEERAEMIARLQKDYEEKRLQRMKGEDEDSDNEQQDEQIDGDEERYEIPDEAVSFGLKTQLQQQHRELDVEDEDDFIIDKDLVASGSDVDLDIESDEDLSEEVQDDNDDDEDFLKEILSEQQNFGSSAEGRSISENSTHSGPCPQDHAQLLALLKGRSHSELNLTIQSIRAAYLPNLDKGNKDKLARFSNALVDHLAHIASEKPPLDVVEILIRHIHSLSKTYTDDVAHAFRNHLQRMYKSGDLNTGDLFILTAISSIYPTSDHFHQVVTPAITIMARWLGLTTSPKATDCQKGAYIVALCVKYQRLSKRYIPEAVRFTTAAIAALPTTSPVLPSHIHNLTSLINLYTPLTAFTAIFTPAIAPLRQHAALPLATSTHTHLTRALAASRLAHPPLELHHHRPLPIKTQIPRFEPSFDPHKRYDPDKARADAAKLRKEHKREHKGALRELRKDAGFIAREKLRAKKAKDAAYAEKERKLIAEIQGTEGAEGNKYEREKRARKGRR